MHPIRENGNASLKMNLGFPLLFLAASIALAQRVPVAVNAPGDLHTNVKVLIAGGLPGFSSPVPNSTILPPAYSRRLEA